MSLVTERSSCRACGGALSTVLDLGEQQVINLGTKEPLRAPLVLAKCQSCGLCQLRHTVDRDYLFRDYYYRSGSTQTMKDHLKGIVDDVMKRVDLHRGDVVVDIGANDGTLLSFYPKDVIKVGYEPANVVQMVVDNMVVSVEFFDGRLDWVGAEHWNWRSGFTTPVQAKAITAVAMLYDLDDPNKFLQDVKRVLAPDGLLVIQVNYLPDTLRNNAVGDVCHEHLCYYTASTLRRLLGTNGFWVEDISFNPINGGSIRVFCRHWTQELRDVGYPMALLEAQTKEYNLDFQAFGERVSMAAVKVKAFLQDAKNRDKVVDVIGASTRGSTFLQYADIDSSVVRFVMERDASKVGRSYLGMPIVSEETAFENPPDVKLAMPYWFRTEILEREKPFLDGGGAVVFPLPEPTIVDKNGEMKL